MTYLRNFWTDEQGQNLIEYSLLMASWRWRRALFWAPATALRGSGRLPTANSCRPTPRAKTPGAEHAGTSVVVVRRAPVRSRARRIGRAAHSRTRIA